MYIIKECQIVDTPTFLKTTCCSMKQGIEFQTQGELILKLLKILILIICK